MTTVEHAIILDDQNLFADSFSLMLEQYGLFKYVRTFSTGKELIDFLLVGSAIDSYIFVDYYLKNENGLAVVSEIKRLNKNARIVFLTSSTSHIVINNILKYSPNAVLSKSCGLQTIKLCIDQVEEGKYYIDDFILEILTENKDKVVLFTPREIELLKYFDKGLSINEAAVVTFLSKHTIVAHRRKMMAKANCHSISQLLKYVRDNGLI